MMNIVRKGFLLLMCLVLVVSFSACKEEKPADTDSDYEIEYEYRDVYDDDDTQGGENTGDSSDKNGKDKNNSSTGSKSNGTKYKSEVRDLKGRTITYVAWWDGTNRNSEAGKKIAETEKLLNCKFVERKMSEYKALYTSILAGDPIADIFCPYDQGALLLAKKNMLTPLDTLPSFHFDEDCWDKACLAENKLNGHYYGMSRNFQIRDVLVYNKTMFEKNGWEDLYKLQSSNKLTWDKLFGIAKSAIQTSSGGKVTRYGFVPKYEISGMASILLGANGVTVASRKGDTTKITYNLKASNSAALTALNKIQTLNKTAGLFYDSRESGWDTGRQIFFSGKAAMALVDSNMFSEIAQNAKFTVGLVLFPHGPDCSNDYVAFSVVPTSIPAGVKNPDDVALFWNTFRNKLGENASAEPDFSDYFPDESVNKSIKKYLQMYQSGKYTAGVSFDIVGEQFAKVTYGETTAVAAISAISQKIDAAIADYWK